MGGPSPSPRASPKRLEPSKRSKTQLTRPLNSKPMGTTCTRHRRLQALGRPIQNQSQSQSQNQSQSQGLKSSKWLKIYRQQPLNLTSTGLTQKILRRLPTLGWRSPGHARCWHPITPSRSSAKTAGECGGSMLPANRIRTTTTTKVTTTGALRTPTLAHLFTECDQELDTYTV